MTQKNDFPPETVPFKNGEITPEEAGILLHIFRILAREKMITPGEQLRALRLLRRE